MIYIFLASLVLAAPPVETVGERAADRARIQRHLAAVEADLRAVDASHLPPALQQARRANLDRLHAYRLAGEFPRNSEHPGERVPYFIDDDGVPCAVGHLVVESGFADIAREIADSENNAKLLAMQHPALPVWIAASGLTAEECARIQPTYCRCDEEYAPVCGVDGMTYQNACYAETCADVEIAYAGVCKGEDTTTGWPSPGTTADATGGSSDTGSSGDTGTADAGTGAATTDEPASTGPASTSGGTTGEPATTGDAASTGASTGVAATTGATGDSDDGPSQAPAQDGGCGCRSPAGAHGLLLALLALLPRRRRRA